jgi:hypothetical protein
MDNRATSIKAFSFSTSFNAQRKNFLARENRIEKDRQFVRDVARKTRMGKGDLSSENPRMP